MTLIAEGLGEKISKGYIYAAMVFSVFVEVLNIGCRDKKKAEKGRPSSTRSRSPRLHSVAGRHLGTEPRVSFRLGWDGFGRRLVYYECERCQTSRGPFRVAESFVSR